VPHEDVVMSVSEAIWDTFTKVLLDVFVKIALGTVVLLFGVSWLLSL